MSPPSSISGFAATPARVPPLLAQFFAREGDSRRAVADVLHELLAAQLDRLPLPGGGATLERWQALSIVGAYDLSLAKLYEGHTDALAILAELGAPQITASGSSWGVWCAEPPGPGVTLHRTATGAMALSGRKQWCSGAATLSHALVSCRDSDGQRLLAAVTLHQPGVLVTSEGWQAVGMADCASVDVVFNNAAALPVGGPGAYLARPGFWYGGAGVAACWYGAARALGARLQAQSLAGASAKAAPDVHQLAHLGQVDVVLSGAAALLINTAAAIDKRTAAGDNKDHEPQALALRLRLMVEAAAHMVLQHTTRALGAAPLCREPAFARLAADLPVFLRQSHAERDLATLGTLLAARPEAPWLL